MQSLKSQVFYTVYQHSGNVSGPVKALGWPWLVLSDVKPSLNQGLLQVTEAKVRFNYNLYEEFDYN